MNSAGVNWAKLVEQNRAKSVGVPWSAEDRIAIYELKIPADYVRKGILTKEDYEAEIEKENAEAPKADEQKEGEIPSPVLEVPDEKKAEEPEKKVELDDLPKEKTERYKYQNLTKLSTENLVKMARDELGLKDLTVDVPRADILKFISEEVSK